jgi:hypothetical protein
MCNFFKINKAEAHLNNIKFSSNRIENTTRLHGNDQLLNAVYGNDRCLQ